MHADLADVIADTAQNSIEAGAKRVELSLVEDGDTIAVVVKDDGKGMDEATLKKAFNPFFTEEGKHDKRKVGLGLPILKQICEACEGTVDLRSTLGKGTILKYTLLAKHIDLPPMGDLVKALLALFNYPGEFELVFSHKYKNSEYTIAKSELVEAVGGLESVEALALAREFLQSQEESLR